MFVSGIAAILNLDGSAIPQSEIERITNVLKPYGPDRQKTLVRKNVAFVFCLHRLTPEDLFERQPIFLANRWIMLFDGCIDNRSELGEALGISASELHSTPDSVIALRMFNRWGERGFEQIVGAFAIIIMDLQQGELICVRDHLGIRVLHYHRSSDRFAVATAPEALFALSWVPKFLNRDKVADTLVRRGLNGETTYYQQINRVLPGCIVRVRVEGFSKSRFWDPENIRDVRFKRDDEYVEAFQERLHVAVKASLRSWRTPCATITGGLDSSSIAVIAADMLSTNGKKLNTFTAVPEPGFFKEERRGLYYDETPYVRQIAQANPNIVPHFIPPSKGPILEQIAEQIRLGGAPSGSILNGLWVMDMYAAARSAGHNVMLTGEVGNLTMSYHGRGLFAELLRTGRWLRLLNEITSSGFRWKMLIRQWTIAPFIPQSLFRRYKQWRRGKKTPWHDYSPVHPEFAIRSGIIERAAKEYMPFDERPARDNRSNRISDIHGYCEMADWFAKLRAGFGIDTRTPAFDRRIVEFCIGIPEDQYLHKGCDRWLIRRAMKGRLPDAVLYKMKYGAQSVDWYARLTRERDHIAEKMKRLTSNEDVASMIDLERLTSILDDWPEREPSFYSLQELDLLMIPPALGAAYFIENVTGTNYGR
jgi:asparagine synthase (glutamine-hydrolysing)